MSDFWKELFSSREGKASLIELRQLKKRGRPLLLLPRQNTAAAVALGLYPAQTSRARALKSLLRLLASTGLPFGAERVSLSISAGNPFAKFLAAQSGWDCGIPQFGILAGNPAHDTQRFIIVLFDPNQRPVTVVKAGLSEPAKALIQREQQFLANVPQKTSGISTLRSAFADPRIKAFALDFIEGESPRLNDERQLPILLSSWVIPNRQVPLSETAAWSQLERPLSISERYSFLRPLGDRKIEATIQHGDFAPWNIKTGLNGLWTVLDWERGELHGVPGWDWFHYVIQTAILVARLPADEIAQRIEKLLHSDAFRTYARQSGISGIERELVIAYLAHLIEVIKPAEGLETNRALLAALFDRRLKNS